MGRSNDLARGLVLLAACLPVLGGRSQGVDVIPPAAAQLVDAVRSSGEITAGPVTESKQTKDAKGRPGESFASVPYQLDNGEKQSLAAFFADPKTYTSKALPVAHDVRFVLWIQVGDKTISVFVSRDSAEVLQDGSKPVELGFGKEGAAAFNQWAVAVIKHHFPHVHSDAREEDESAPQAGGGDSLTDKLLNGR